MLMLEGNLLVADVSPSESIVVKLSGRKKRLFLVCDYCYWSASALPTRRFDLSACPECTRPISSLPLPDEEQIGGHDDLRGFGPNPRWNESPIQQENAA